MCKDLIMHRINNSPAGGPEMSTFLENVLKTLKRGVELGGFPEELYKMLSKPERIVIVKIPVRMDDGRLEVFEGYRVQHNSALGP